MTFKLLPVLPEFASQVIIMTKNATLEQLPKEELFKRVVSCYQLDNYYKGSQVRKMPV